jgi:DNA-binding MarR family transcriptional regulator
VVEYTPGVACPGDGAAPAQGSGGSLADQVWALLLRLSFDRLQHHVGATAADLRLAPRQAFVLHELGREQPLSMRDLAERLKCDPSNITGLVDRLEARGLVERRPDPRDRRVTAVALTAAGDELRRRLLRRLYAAPACVARLPEADQRALQRLLAQVLAEDNDAKI